MPKKTFTPEQILQKLREVEVSQSKGLSVQESVRQIEVMEQTYYRWKKEYGGMRKDQRRWGRLHLEKAFRLLYASGNHLYKQSGRSRKFENVHVCKQS